MMNIGFNPTFSGTKQTIEIHFIDFNKDLYGLEIQVELLHRLRDEQKFDSVDALKSQLFLDKETTQRFITKHHAS